MILTKSFKTYAFFIRDDCDDKEIESVLNSIIDWKIENINFGRI